MKAAVLVGYGGVDQLELREVPEPKTGPGQVKVRVVGASINRSIGNCVKARSAPA